MPLVDIEVGMERHYIAVAPNMIEPLGGIGITVTDHTLYLIVTPRGGLRIIPVRGPNSGWRAERIRPHKEAALIDGIDGWVACTSTRRTAPTRVFRRLPIDLANRPGRDQARETLPHGVSRPRPADR